MAVIAVGSKGRVNTNDVNVRENAGTSYNRVYYAQSGDIVTVQDSKTGTDGKVWLKITNETRYTSKIGWIRNDFVDAYSGSGNTGSGTVSGECTIYTSVDTTVCGDGGSLNLRQTASTSANVLAEIPNGSSVRINTNSGTWVKVLYNNIEGYAMAKFIVGTQAYNAEADGSDNSGLTDWEVRYGTRNYSKSNTYYEKFKNVQTDINAYLKKYGYDWVAVYPLQVDGVMGNASEVGVMLFQQYENLLDANNSPDGIVGPATKARLYARTR